jgi:hypothetical protein
MESDFDLVSCCIFDNKMGKINTYLYVFNIITGLSLPKNPLFLVQISFFLKPNHPIWVAQRKYGSIYFGVCLKYESEIFDESDF